MQKIFFLYLNKMGRNSANVLSGKTKFLLHCIRSFLLYYVCMIKNSMEGNVGIWENKNITC